jgi:ornithine cyclodeaminase/alanine dehydrogenase-like protein (mu-crystallin family)
MRVLEQTFREQSDGKVEPVPPLRLMNRGMRLVVGGLDAQKRTGLRLSVKSGEGIALLFEITSGNFLAIMGYPFSNLRISATIGLALDHLAKPNAEAVALIGSGRLAMPVLKPAVALRPIRRIKVYSRNPENRDTFARKAIAALGIPAAAAASPHEAIAEADLVLVSTNSPTAALLGRWLRSGLSIFGAGRPNEFDDEVYLRANLISVASKTHELGYYDTKLDQPLIRLSQQGKIPWAAVAELGDILGGKVRIPDASTSLIVFRDSQGGYGDIALAAWVYEEARKKGLGREISLE